MPSFDVVSKLTMHEVDNAVQQAQKEVSTRYDFRDMQATIERGEEGITLRANAKARVEAAYLVLQEKLAKRKVSLKSLDPQPAEPAGGNTYKQLVKLQQGIEKEKAKEVVKYLKDTKLKVQAAIQGDSVRVTGKKRDDLQEAIGALRRHDFGIELQYENFRD
ncbi:MAG TPA: YajQ family cyclic di-GMP-binding protein [Polyangiales bacterium]|nr:YajQ family cyclic di-GMP-binding protein [Polyangiales bacterium]